ncbi:MAG TPA: DNA polymerase III subunit alpha [Thermomicrobiales bacterium]|nr:DNA polymerase III subunit alpha [Thermomicrobiales bacterium]
MAEFAHLHLHTEFSLLDGVGRIDQYIERAHQLGLQHIAVTDHGVMYASLSWYNAATEAGLHPIIGMEAYLAEGLISERKRESYHLLLLAANETGYRNLLKLASIASLEGFYYRPRIDLELLQQYHEGIIATSACIGGPVAKPFLNGDIERAERYAGTLSEIFGRDRFFIEIQNHGIDLEEEANRFMIPLAKRMNLPIVATNDVHYNEEDDAAAQDLLVCVQTNTTLNDPKRLKSDSTQLYLKSAGEMERLFGHIPEAITNTVRIAEMCSLDLGFKGYQLPHFDVPEEFTPSAYLRKLVEEGARRKYGTIEGAVCERIDHELGIIENMGFTNYFLIVWDFVRFAKERGILVGPGRGSAAGSVVTYALDITGLDPLKYELFFERFLNPSRISMPDIDIDFADDRRDEVIEYVVDKYGDDRVAQIITFGTLKAKAAVRDVGRAMDLGFGETDRVARLIPTDPKMTIEKALETVPDLGKLYESDAQVRELIDTAKKVEGHARHSSTHAAGVVISRDPLVEQVPLQYAGGKSEGDVTTQWTQDHLESLGLLKMDFLGLKTLTVLGKAIALLAESGHNISLEDTPLEDPEALALLRRGETFGVFQLEGGMTRRMTIDVAPESFDDLVALMALIRPGPLELAPDFIARKHGREPVEYIHPLVEPILEKTYGIAIYQEQVMQIANAVAGFSMAEADGLRKAMGKKLPEVMAKYESRFIEGAVENGTDKDLAKQIFDMIEAFAGYGFNKAHSAAYAVIAAQTGYFKANFPVQFMAALMSTEMNSSEKTVVNIAECRRTGIPILPPDVNRSGVEFSVEKLDDGTEAIRFAMGAIRNVGVGAVETIVAARKEQPTGEFASLEDFCDSVSWSKVGRRVAENLCKVGALEGFGERNAVLKALETAIASAQQRQKAADRGQTDMFGMVTAASPGPSERTLSQVPEASNRERLDWEKELLGFYLSAHPINEVVGKHIPQGYAEIVDLESREPGERVRMLGMVVDVRKIITKTNKSMAIVKIEDLTGTIEVVCFPETYERIGEMLEVDAIIEVSGKFERRNEEPQIVADNATRDLPEFEAGRPKDEPIVALQLPGSEDVWSDISLMQNIDRVLNNHEGTIPVEFRLPRGTRVIRLRSRSRTVEWSDEFRGEMGELLGATAVTLEEPARESQAAD